MNGFILLLVIGTTIWVGIDASNLGVQRGRLSGSSLDMSTASWVICCLLLWIVAFPCYLVARGKYVAMKNAPAGYGQAGWGAPQGYGYAPPQGYGYPQPQAYAAPVYQAPPQQVVSAPVAPAVAPPQLSPDGHWWWDGQQWTAVATS